MVLFAVADFCLIPMATPTPSVGEYIAEVQKVLARYEKEEGVKYEMHGYGTNLEGPFPVVCRAIEEAHEAVHRLGAPRIATDIRLGTRVDKAHPSQTFDAGTAASSADKSSSSAATADDDQSWAEGLGENERKRESVRRRLAKESS